MPFCGLIQPLSTGCQTKKLRFWSEDKPRVSVAPLLGPSSGNKRLLDNSFSAHHLSQRLNCQQPRNKEQ